MRRDDADKPGQDGATESRAAEIKSGEPVRILTKRFCKPGDVQGILRRQPETRNRRARVEQQWCLRVSDDSRADNGAEQPARGDDHLRQTPEGQRREPTAN